VRVLHGIRRSQPSRPRVMQGLERVSMGLNHGHRFSPLPGGERSGRACAIRVRGNRPHNKLRSPLTRNGREARPFRPLPNGER
jgi:hypothetical protein